MLSITPTILYCDGGGFWNKFVNDSPYEHTKITPDQFMDALNHTNPDMAAEQVKALISKAPPQINHSATSTTPVSQAKIPTDDSVQDLPEEWQNQMFASN